MGEGGVTRGAVTTPYTSKSLEYGNGFLYFVEPNFKDSRGIRRISC
jgi:hypothetical protein